MNNKDIGYGGGEVLQYIGNGSSNRPTYLDESVLQQFRLLPYIRIGIVLLLLIIAALVIIKLFEVKNPLTGRAITTELEHLERVRKRDANIVRANKIMLTLTNIIENSPFSLSKSLIDYWKYNLERANIRIPGGARVMKPQELNAIIKSIQIVGCILCGIITVFLSAPVGVMMIICIIVIGSTLPMQTIRSIVKVKDMEIVENFADFYLMIHYVLLASAGTPISSVMKSYDKTTTSDEMHRFVDVCIHNIDTFGEYEATRHIGRHYREIPQVSKLMRLIRQANEGGDVRAELIGFRDELLSAKKYAIEQRMHRIIEQAKLSFNILLPILFQAIISAMAIYVEDLKLTSTFM